MKTIPLYRLLEWFGHPDTHPAVVKMCRIELARRGYNTE